jgi:hypothetical protein
MMLNDLNRFRDKITGTVRETMPSAAFAAGLSDVDPAAVMIEAKTYVAALAVDLLPEDLGLSKVRAWLAGRGDARSELFVKAVRHEMILVRLRIAAANGKCQLHADVRSGEQPK